MEDYAEALNKADEGRFATSVGVVIDSATADRVSAHLDLEPRHLQPMGIVHGGVYCRIVETVASVGAAISALADGKTSAGVENHTSFLRSISGGRVSAVATAIQRGRTMHLWEVEIRDQEERLLAKGSVRLIIREPHGSRPGSDG